MKRNAVDDYDLGVYGYVRNVERVTAFITEARTEVYAPPGMTEREIDKVYRFMAFDGERYYANGMAMQWVRVARGRMGESPMTPHNGDAMIDALMELKV